MEDVADATRPQLVEQLAPMRSIATLSAALSLVRPCRSRAELVKLTTAPRSSGSIASTKFFEAARRKPWGSLELIEPDESSTNAASMSTVPPPPPPRGSHVPPSPVHVSCQLRMLKTA